MFIDGQLEERKNAGELPDRKKSYSGLRAEELMISKRPSKGPSNLDSRYQDQDSLLVKRRNDNHSQDL